jgi:putative ATP-dependent endonuclease of OLD family
MNVPVAIVTDVDVPTWLKTVDCDAQGKPLTGADGKLRFVYAARPAAEVDAETSIETTALSLKYDQQSIKAFVAPKWTLEYSLSKSPVFGEAFGVALKRAHPQVDPGRIEEELARKLISRSLDKTELAHRLALALDADSRSAAQAIVPRLDDPAAAYLLLAIKHACRA